MEAFLWEVVQKNKRRKKMDKKLLHKKKSEENPVTHIKQ